MTTFTLPSGEIVLIDDQDAPLVSRYRWYARHTRSGTYVRTAESLYLHRLLMGFPPFVDHKNNNPLDNRRENLRAVTKHQNNMNVRPPRDGLPKGVRYDHRQKTRPWEARIRVNRKLIHLGSFATPVEAADAYDNAARVHFGEYARPNNMAKTDWAREQEHNLRYVALTCSREVLHVH